MGLRDIRRKLWRNKVENEKKGPALSQPKGNGQGGPTVVAEIKIQLFDDQALSVSAPESKITFLGMMEFAKLTVMSKKAQIGEEKKIQLAPAGLKIKATH